MDAQTVQYGAKEPDRVRRATSPSVNQEIDTQTQQRVEEYRGRSAEEIAQRIAALEREWDIERVLEVNAATVGLTGFALGAMKDRRWLTLPAVVMAFLLQHGLQGWCPPVPVFRRIGVRTRAEIDQEKCALRAMLRDATYV